MNVPDFEPHEEAALRQFGFSGMAPTAFTIGMFIDEIHDELAAALDRRDFAAIRAALRRLDQLGLACNLCEWCCLLQRWYRTKVLCN